MSALADFHQVFRCGSRVVAMEVRLPKPHPVEQKPFSKDAQSDKPAVETQPSPLLSRPQEQPERADQGFVFLADIEDCFDITIAHFSCNGVSIPLLMDASMARYIPERVPCRKGFIIDVIKSSESSLTELTFPNLDLDSGISSAANSNTSNNSLGSRSNNGRIASVIESLKVGSSPSTSALQQLKPMAPPLSTPNPTAPIPLKLRGPQSLPSPTFASSSSKAGKDDFVHYVQPGAPHGKSQFPSGTVQEQYPDEAHLFQLPDPTTLPYVQPSLPHVSASAMIRQTLHSHPAHFRRSALILDKADLILSKKYELHESSRPKLFVILPERIEELSDDGVKEKSLLESQKFRVHYLCECGNFNNNSVVGDRQEVYSSCPEGLHINHPDSHPGYAINKPHKFLARFLPYLLVIMEALLLGGGAVSIGGRRIEDLHAKGAAFRSKEMCLAVQQSVDFLEAYRAQQRQEPMVNEGHHTSQQTTSCYDHLGKFLQGVEEIDLTSVEPFLEGISLPKSASGGRVLGGMYRIYAQLPQQQESRANQTPTNQRSPKTIQWVCKQHYIIHHGFSQQHYMQQYHHALAPFAFDEQLGVVTATSLKSPLDAKKFYRVLWDLISPLAYPTSFIMSLDLTLDWNQDYADLIKLREVITDMQVESLGLNLRNQIGPDSELDFKGRYNPVLEIMALPTLKVCYFNKVLGEMWTRSTAVVESPLWAVGQLRSFSMVGTVLGGSGPGEVGGGGGGLGVFIEKAHQLESLTLVANNVDEGVRLFNIIWKARLPKRLQGQSQQQLQRQQAGVATSQLSSPQLQSPVFGYSALDIKFVSSTNNSDDGWLRMTLPGKTSQTASLMVDSMAIGLDATQFIPYKDFATMVKDHGFRFETLSLGHLDEPLARALAHSTKIIPSAMQRLSLYGIQLNSTTRPHMIQYLQQCHYPEYSIHTNTAGGVLSRMSCRIISIQDSYIMRVIPWHTLVYVHLYNQHQDPAAVLQTAHACMKNQIGELETFAYSQDEGLPALAIDGLLPILKILTAVKELHLYLKLDLVSWIRILRAVEFRTVKVVKINASGIGNEMGDVDRILDLILIHADECVAAQTKGSRVTEVIVCEQPRQPQDTSTTVLDSSSDENDEKGKAQLVVPWPLPPSTSPPGTKINVPEAPPPHQRRQLIKLEKVILWSANITTAQVERMLAQGIVLKNVWD